MEPSGEYWTGRRVCVTGGTGLLGSHLVRLLLECAARVRVLALPPHKKHPLRFCDGLDLVFGDVCDGDLVRRCMSDCDTIFHTAAIVADWGPALAKLHEVHVRGTRNVLQAAPDLARVVHTSSIVTIGASLHPEILDETSPFTLHRLKVDYMQAKRDSESLALGFAARGRDVVITNPAYLFGPDDPEGSVMLRFFKRYWRGRVPLISPGGLNLADVRDVARGHLLAAEHGKPGRRYILGGENCSFPDLMKHLALAGGMRPWLSPVVPWWVLFAIAESVERWSLLTRKQPYPSRQQARLNRYYWYYRSTRAATELGYTSRPLAESLSDTFRWCLDRSVLKLRGPSRWWMRPDPKIERTSWWQRQAG
jgi:dihydroflavonol-4-reductase